MTKTKTARLCLASGCSLLVIYLVELVNLINSYEALTNDVTNTISAFYG